MFFMVVIIIVLHFLASTRFHSITLASGCIRHCTSHHLFYVLPIVLLYFSADGNLGDWVSWL